MLDSLQHLVEGAYEDSAFVITLCDCPQRVVLLCCNPAGNPGKLNDRVTHDTQKACTDQGSGQDGNEKDQNSNLGVFPESGTNATQIGNDRDGAGLVALEIYALELREGGCSHVGAVGFQRWHRESSPQVGAAILSKDSSVQVVQACA